MFDLKVVSSFVGQSIVYVAIYNADNVTLNEAFDTRYDIKIKGWYPYRIQIPLKEYEGGIQEIEHQKFFEQREGLARKLDKELSSCSHVEMWDSINYRSKKLNESRET